MSVDVFSGQRFLMWLDDASDVVVVLWALLPMPLTIVATLDGSFPLRPERRWHKPTGNPSGRAAPSLLGSSLSPCRSKPRVRRWPGFLSAPCWALEVGLGRVMLQQRGRNTASHPWSSLSCALLLLALTNSHCWSASIHLLFWWVPIVHSN